MEKVKKSRYWALVVYPDSLPADWLQLLTATGLQVAISPLHDKDVNDSTGEVKKVHYHLVLCFEGPTTYNCVKDIADTLNAPIPQAVNSVIGAVRYLTHQDNPEKAQYNKDDIKTLNGLDIGSLTAPTLTEKNAIKRLISVLIREEHIIDYGYLLQRLETENETWWTIAAENTILFRACCDTQYRIKKRLIK